MCVERVTRTIPSRAAETIAMDRVVDEEELVSSCARMAWTATRAVVVNAASVPSTVGILEGTAIVMCEVERENEEEGRLREVMPIGLERELRALRVEWSVVKVS